MTATESTGAGAGPFPDPSAPLRDVPFVVVDLETTGGSPTGSRVTEVGAVRVRGGEVVGELATLVDPGVPIPTSIQRLTGITPSMVAQAPPDRGGAADVPGVLPGCGPGGAQRPVRPRPS